MFYCAWLLAISTKANTWQPSWTGLVTASPTTLDWSWKLPWTKPLMRHRLCSHHRLLKVKVISSFMSLPALHIYNRTGPTMPGGSTFTPQTYNDEQWEKAMKEYRLCVLCRMIGSSGKQPMPAFGGFISATGKTPDKKSTIGYYPPINEPITEYNTVAELLKRSAEATAEVGQKYTIAWKHFPLSGHSANSTRIISSW